jgi:hypothetical protein
MPEPIAACPTCQAPVYRLQPSWPHLPGGPITGPVAAYGCTCWLTPDQVRALVATHRTGGPT